MSSVASDDVATPELVWLDPKELTANPANVRSDLRNLDELASSIAESGIVEPLVVVPLEDGHRILAGHRRAAAAVIADVEAVPCWERADLADLEADQLAAALAENLQRDNLTPVEEAHAYAQLAAFPTWSIERIASASGRPVDRVRRGVAATRLPDGLQESAALGELTLEDAQQLESFADDAATYRRLLSHVGERNFSHMLRQAQRDREINERLAASRAQLTEAGVPIISEPGYRDVEVRLADLYDDEGEPLDETTHSSCPGHAAYLDAYTGDAVYVCQDPKASGHSTPPWYKHLSKEAAEALAAEEEAARARTAELEVAADVRRSFVRNRIAAKGKPPTGTLRFVVQMTLDDDAAGLAELEDVAWYLGHDDPKSIDLHEALDTAVRKTSDSRLPLLLLAEAAAAAEENLDAYGQHWRYSPAITLRWFGFLTGLGYSLSDAEQTLVQEARLSFVDASSNDEAAQ